MPWIRKFNFRQNAGYNSYNTAENATSDETYVLAENYTGSVIRQGVAFGYTSGGGTIQTRDRSTSVDRRLAGTHFTDIGAPATFQVDLPANGTYIIGLSSGDESGVAVANMVVEVLDDSTSKFAIDHTTGYLTASNNHRDANDVLTTAAGWVSAGVAGTTRTVSFSSTILNIKIGTATRQGALVHLYVEQVTAGTFIAKENYRDTPGTSFVTDIAPEVCVTSAGWTGAGGTQDASSSLDRRLAGFVFRQNDGGGQATRVITLPSTGFYRLRMAVGTNSPHAPQYVQIQDNTTPVLTLYKPGGSATSEWFDAQGTGRTDASWAATYDAAYEEREFFTTTLRIVVGTPTLEGASYSTLAHFSVEGAASGTSAFDETDTLPVGLTESLSRIITEEGGGGFNPVQVPTGMVNARAFWTPTRRMRYLMGGVFPVTVPSTASVGRDDTLAVGLGESINLIKTTIGGGAGDFPVLMTSNSGDTTTNVTVQTINLPTGLAVDDLVMAFLTTDQNAPGSWPSGWTMLYSQAGAALTGEAYYRIWTGAETSGEGSGGTLSVNTGATGQMSSHVTVRVDGELLGVTPEATASPGGSNTLVDPPSLTAVAGAENLLWLAVAHYDDGTATLSVAAPTTPSPGFTAVASDRSAGQAQGTGTGVAKLNLNTATVDPGTFTISLSKQWIGGTVVIRPAAGGGGAAVDVAPGLEALPVGLTETASFFKQIFVSDVLPVGVNDVTPQVINTQASTLTLNRADGISVGLSEFLQVDITSGALPKDVGDTLKVGLVEARSFVYAGDIVPVPVSDSLRIGIADITPALGFIGVLPSPLPPGGALAVEWLVDLGSFTVGTRTYVEGTTTYQPAILGQPAVSRRMDNVWFGFTDAGELTLRLRNETGQFNTLWDARGQSVRARRYDRERDVMILEFMGIIDQVSFGADSLRTVTVRAANQDLRALETKIPRRTSTTTLFGASCPNPGVAIPKVIGNVQMMPLTYVTDDVPGIIFRYMVSEGAATVVNVYRDTIGEQQPQVLQPSEFTVETVSGVTMVRTYVRQIKSGGGFHKLWATVSGPSQERNLAYAIKAVLSDTTWGLGLVVDSTSFDAAAAAIPSGFVIDGVMEDQRPAIDYLNTLLELRGCRLTYDYVTKWGLTVDTAAGSIALTLADETMLAQAKTMLQHGERARSSLAQDVTTLIVEYAPNYLTGKGYLYTAATRTVSPVGAEKRLQHDFLRDRTAADMWACYLAKRMFYAADLVTGCTVTEEGRILFEGSLVNVYSTPLQLVGATRQVVMVNKGSGRVDVTHAAWSSDIYSHDLLTLPPLQISDSSITPSAVSAISMIETGINAGGDGSSSAYAIIQFTAPAEMFVSSIRVDYRLVGGTYGGAQLVYGSGVMAVRINGLLAGRTYDFRVVPFNGTVPASEVVLPNQTVASSSAPTAPTSVSVVSDDYEVSVLGTDLSVVAWVILQFTIDTVNNVTSTIVDYKRTAMTTVYGNAMFVRGTGTVQVRIEGLVPGLSYDFRITSFNGTLAGTPHVMAPYIAAYDDPPAPPSSPTITESGVYIASDTGASAYVIVQWTSSSSPTVTGTRIDYRRNGSTVWGNGQILRGAGVQSVKIEGLVPGQSYDYRTTSLTMALETSATPLFNQIAASDTAPNQPGAISIPNSGAATSSEGSAVAFVVLEFIVTTSSPALSGTRVEYRRNTFSVWGNGQVVRGTGSVQVRIDGLTPGLSYDYRAVSFTGTLESPERTLLNQLAPGDTTTPSAPSALSVRQGGGKVVEIDISFAAPPDWADMLLYRNTVNNSATASVIARGKKNRFHDQNINYATQYHYWAKVRDLTAAAAGITTGVGVSAFSPVASITINQIQNPDIGSGQIDTSHIATNAISQLAGVGLGGTFSFKDTGAWFTLATIPTISTTGPVLGLATVAVGWGTGGTGQSRIEIRIRDTITGALGPSAYTEAPCPVQLIVSVSPIFLDTPRTSSRSFIVEGRQSIVSVGAFCGATVIGFAVIEFKR